MVRELHGIQFQLERIAEMFELLLNQQNMYIAPSDQTVNKEDDDELMYRDERQAVLQELAEALRLRKGGVKEEE
jgi:hypothetical protein